MKKELLFVFSLLALSTLLYGQSITVISPNGGETLIAGTNYNITWSDNISENVKIELYKNNVFSTVIVASTPSDGSHPWTIPSSTAAGNDYKIMIVSVNNSAINDWSNNYFSILLTKQIENLSNEMQLQNSFSDIKIYPNPAKRGSIYINFENDLLDGNLELSVYNSFGELIEKFRSNDIIGNVLTLNAIDFTCGMYFFKSRSLKTTVIKTFIITD